MKLITCYTVSSKVVAGLYNCGHTWAQDLSIPQRTDSICLHTGNATKLCYYGMLTGNYKHYQTRYDPSDFWVTFEGCFKILVALIEQCFTSPPTQYRLYGRLFLQVKRPNQQYQSTEGESCKGKQHKLHICIHTQNSRQIQHTCITQQVP